jgi:hypothetical protein
MAKTIVGLYDNFNTTQQVLQDLANAGIARENISLVASDAAGEYGRQFTTTDDQVDEVGSGAGVGAGVGAILGGIGGLLVGLGALAIPGIGPVIAAGPLITALAGAGIGAVAGGLVGALTEMGVPEEEAHYYAEGVRRGGHLVTVNSPDDMADEVRDIMNRYNPVDIDERSAQWRASGWTGFDADAQSYTTEGDTVRRKDVDVEDLGSTSTTYNDYRVYDTDFRQHYTTNFANSGYTYDQYSPAYRYGYDLAYDDMYRGYTWEELEPEAERYWMEEHEGTWENFKDAVRHAWERTKDVFDGDNDTSYDASRRSSTARSRF